MLVKRNARAMTEVEVTGVLLMNTLYQGLYGGWLKSAYDHKEYQSIKELQELMARAYHTNSYKKINGEVAQFDTKSCLSAAKKLANQQSLSATCRSCSLSIQGPNGILSAKSIPSSRLVKATVNILKAWVKGESMMLSATEISVTLLLMICSVFTILLSLIF
ncbi:hypothetical protein BY996DRAFT_6410163 [Phakopsora pachyrhizi]|nr:hypothetical protein BY996DRAFT_6410163 [Phakopsora pachyrhizi]